MGTCIFWLFWQIFVDLKTQHSITLCSQWSLAFFFFTTQIFSRGEEVCVYFFEENSVKIIWKNTFFLVKSIDLEIFPLRKLMLDSFHQLRWEMLIYFNFENFYFYLEKQQFILVSNNFKKFTWLAKKRVGSFENKFYFGVNTMYFGVSVINYKENLPFEWEFFIH